MNPSISRRSLLKAVPAVGIGTLASEHLVLDAQAVDRPMPGGCSGGIVDAVATPQTRQLDAYLRSFDGSHTLFMHMDDNHHGATFTYEQADGRLSELYNSFGKRPAVVGFDAIWVWGWDASAFLNPTPAKTADVTARISKMSALMRAADAQGSIITMGAHIPNMMTGGDSWSSGGLRVTDILPGGRRNAEFLAALDVVVRIVQGARRADGTLIPVVLRLFHEMNGHWFWWGTAMAAEEYKALWQYTVAYLRDTRQVHNLLYVYAPDRTTQAGLGADREAYLAKYPGDSWVDGFGYDGYDDFSTPMADFISSAVRDLAMVTDLAAERCKFATLSETGPADLYKVSQLPADVVAARSTWFSSMVAAIEADPKARRIAWFGLWSNDTTKQYWMPWRTDGFTSPWYDDFAKVVADPYLLFAPVNPYRGGVPRTELPLDVALVLPTLLANAAGSSYELVAATSGLIHPERAVVTASVDGGAPIPMRLGADGLYHGTWQVTDLTQHVSLVTITVRYAGSTASDSARVLVGPPKPQVLPLVDDFENYWGLSESAQAVWAKDGGVSSIALVPRDGGHALEVEADFSQSWAGAIRSIDADQSDWSAWSRIRWFAQTNPACPVTVAVVAAGISFEAAVQTTEAGGYVEVPFSSLRVAGWDTAHQGATIDLTKVQRLAFYPGPLPQVATTMVIDDITLA